MNENTGAVVSITVIVCSPDAVFPHASVAEKVLTRVIKPQFEMIVSTSSITARFSFVHSSYAVANSKNGTAGQLTEMSSGTLRMGGMSSSTVMTLEAFTEAPHASVNEYVWVWTRDPIQLG